MIHVEIPLDFSVDSLCYIVRPNTGPMFCRKVHLGEVRICAADDNCSQKILSRQLSICNRAVSSLEFGISSGIRAKSNIAYGYRIEGGKAIICKEEAEKLQQLFKNYLAGMSLSKAAAGAGIQATHSHWSRQYQMVRFHDQQDSKKRKVYGRRPSSENRHHRLSNQEASQEHEAIIPRQTGIYIVPALSDRHFPNP